MNDSVSVTINQINPLLILSFNFSLKTIILKKITVSDVTFEIRLCVMLIVAFMFIRRIFRVCLDWDCWMIYYIKGRTITNEVETKPKGLYLVLSFQFSVCFIIISKQSVYSLQHMIGICHFVNNQSCHLRQRKITSCC